MYDYILDGDCGRLIRDGDSNIVGMMFAKCSFWKNLRLDMAFAHEVKSLLRYVKEEFGLLLEPL